MKVHIISIVSIYWVFASTLYANSFWGVNAKSLSLGSAQTTGVDDYSAVYYNPAKLAFISISNGISYQNSFYDLNINFKDNRKNTDKKDFNISDIKKLQDHYYSYTAGFTIPIFEKEDYALNSGFLISLTNGDIAKIKVFDEKTYQYYRYHSSVETIDMNLGIGFKFLKNYSIGLGIRQLVSVKGEANVDFKLGNDLDNDPNNDSQILAKEIYLNVLSERSFVFSLFAKLDPFFLALVFKDSIELPYKIPARITIKEFEGEKDTILNLMLKGIGVYKPKEINLGLSYHISKSIINLDLSYQLYSLAPQPYSYASVDNFNEDSLLYMKAKSDDFKIKFRNTLNIALSYSFDNTLYQINTGLQFRQSLIEKTNRFVNFVDNDTLGFSLGFRLNINKMLNINTKRNFHISLAYSLQRHIYKTEKNTYYNSNVKYGGNVQLLFLDLSVN